ncbi:MAG: MBL fold metallo-hydrolase [Pseudomonadota bacterium]|nr:MBL fold metallo-hydrolase [Pseudomonadota bacterium]
MSLAIIGIWQISIEGLALLRLVVVNGGASPQTKWYEKVHFPGGGDILQNTGGCFQKLVFQLADVRIGYVSILSVGGSSFLMSSPGEVRIAADYNVNYWIEELPDVATMDIGLGNHSSHDMHTSITHLLPGWSTDGGVAHRDVTFMDVRVYDLATNPQKFEGGSVNFSSIFIFLSNGLCVFHMGHLAHLWNKGQLYQIGRIDLLIIPVNGRVTSRRKELTANFKAISPRCLVSMPFNEYVTLNEFLKQAEHQFKTKSITGNTSRIRSSSIIEKVK